MLEIGNPGLSLNEQKVHFSLWSIMASPLLMATNLLYIPKESLDILLNKYAIAVNQDPMGIQGHKLYANKSGTEIWFRPLSNQQVGVVLLNRMSEGKMADITVNFVSVGISSNVKSVTVYDLWDDNKNVGNFPTSYTAKNIDGHSCSMIKLVPNQ